MAAPTPTARQTPAGIPVWDGYQVLYTFKRFPAVKLWEKATTPPGVEGGEGIDQTTQHNAFRRTKKPRALYEMTDGSFTCGYDPVVYDTILQMVNIEDEVTALFCDGSTIVDYGYLRSFIPAQMVEGTMPEATVTIVWTGLDPGTSLLEQAPVTTSIPGT